MSEEMTKEEFEELTEAMDFTDLEKEEKANVIAAEIETIKRQAARFCLQASVEIGRLLCEAKAIVPHGSWTGWLQVNVDYSQSTANNLMKLFREYGEDEQLSFFSENKMEIFGSLTPSQALALIELPREERKDYVTTHDMNEASVRDMKREIAELKAMKEKADIEAIKALKERDEAEASRMEAERKQKEALEKRNAQEREESKKLEDVREKLKSLEEEKEKALRKAKELEKAIEEEKRKKQEQMTIEPVIVEVPRDLSKEPMYLEALAEVEKLKGREKRSGEEHIKFKLIFGEWQRAFKAAIEALDEITDADMKEKYKAAMRGVHDAMRGKIS